ncbi:unnamed protein product [Linum trigynum]|uniref:Uncharacterized protein n=1 Tax=Linum trigynum TaxID=586398 RepID=A0AAV2FHH6_9ROSI
MKGREERVVAKREGHAPMVTASATIELKLRKEKVDEVEALAVKGASVGRRNDINKSPLVDSRRLAAG